jgi:prepilin-type N-terminal cleavage/methylation domain-containing protein
MQNKQCGFTLVELAIVLTIIGLLLGGVLKGQELITNSKLRNLQNDLNAVQASYYAYLDRYRVMPGDDGAANTRFSGAPQQGNGDGTIDAAKDWNSATANDETRLFWLHLRNAGLVKGDTTSQTQPNNAFDLMLGVQQRAAANNNGLAGVVVCTSVEDKYAQGIDASLDDGVATTGDLRSAASSATANAVAGAAAAYAAPTEGNYRTLCRKI